MFSLGGSCFCLLLVLHFRCVFGVHAAIEEERSGKVIEGALTRARLATHLFKYFSDDYPRGLPALKLEDPMVFSESYQLTSGLTIWDQHLHGLSHFEIEAAAFNLSSLTVQVDARLPVLWASGQYLWRATMFWSNDEAGATNITLHDIRLSFRSVVVPDADGRLTLVAGSTELEMTYNRTEVSFENLSSTYHLGVNTALPVFLPSLVKLVKEWLVEELNPELQKLADGWYFPDSTSPFDYLMTKLRGYLRTTGMEPWRVGKMALYLGYGFTFKMDNTVVSGLSSLHRNKDIFVKVMDHTFIVFAQVGAQQVKVTGEWWVPYLLGTGGHLEATIDTFSATFEVQQKVDMKSPAVLRTLDCQIGHPEAVEPDRPPSVVAAAGGDEPGPWLPQPPLPVSCNFTTITAIATTITTATSPPTPPSYSTASVASQ
ncbi:uncharacterized protein [Cherax quadricarinatus]|uniref:uncharacterized protein isoform X2 n=1 Tax=Cherax quadricarinatus TaxID=27406 RepID=UPI00387EDB19